MPGECLGVSKRLAINFWREPNFPPTRENIDWAWDVLDYDFIVRPGARADIRRFLSLSGDHTFVTYIKYQDLFTKQIHTSWMGMYMS